MTVTFSTKEIQRPKIVEGIMNKQFESELLFKDLFPVVQNDAVGYTYMEDLTTAGEDISSGKMGKPNELGEQSDLAEIDISEISLKHGSMKRYGYKIKISPKALREVSFVDELKRAYERAGFGMAYKINSDIVAAFKAKANGITEVDGTAVWSADNADPIKDIIKFKKAMKLDGFPYRLNRLYVHEDNYSEFEEYMVSIDRSWAINPRTEEDIPAIRGVQIMDAGSADLAEGSYMGFDRRYPAATIYKYMEPGYSSASADNRIMIHRYVEERYPHNIVIEMVTEYGIAIKVPNAFCYKSSGI
jgi:hypothetical protein